MTSLEDGSDSPRYRWVGRYAAWLAVASIWLATVAAGVWSPDMITGSQQEHLPITLMLGWLWAAVATGYVMMARPSTRHGVSAGDSARTTFGVILVWVATAVVSIAGPSLVTGTDPTQIPLPGIVAPLVAMAATGFICLYAAAIPRA